MLCPNCGSPVSEEDGFCANCGHAVGDAGASSSSAVQSASAPASEPTAKSPKEKKTTPVAIVAAIALLAALVAGGWYFLSSSRSLPKQELPAEPAKQEQQEASKADADKESQQTAKETPAMRAANAYEAILANAGAYFAEPWYGQTPDADITYALVNLTDDDIPELLLSTHYSNVGSHTSGGYRMLVFTHDGTSDAAVQASSDEFELFNEPYALIDYDAANHALFEELRYAAGMNSLYYQVKVDDAMLVREELDGAMPEESKSPFEFVPVSDQAPLDQLRGGSAQPQEEKPTQDSESEHDRLRSEAEAAGKTVLTGRVVVVQGEDAIAYTGEKTFYANGDKGIEANAASWYALLVLDEPTEIFGILQADSTVSGTYDCILLGIRRYNAYSGSYDDEDGVAAWEEYGTGDTGTELCIAASDFSKSSGTDYPGLPCPREVEVLYTLG